MGDRYAATGRARTGRDAGSGLGAHGAALTGARIAAEARRALGAPQSARSSGRGLFGPAPARRRSFRWWTIASIAFAGITLAQTAALAVIDTVPVPETAVAAMRVGPITSQPIGHYEFCRRNPEECSVRSAGSRPETLTPGTWMALDEINRAVNGGIAPRTDFEMHGRVELWSFPDVAGDCEDYVLLKRRLLTERGIDPANLLITVVLRPNGEGHAVLTVRTDRGDFVLDNLDERVRSWTETPYRFLKRQSAHHSGRWVDITNGHVRSVASVR